MMVAGAAASASGQSAKKSVDIIESPSVHGFSVTLVLGDMRGASTPDNLPPGAKKALADMRDFLPYKSYRLLDTQWILCCGSSKIGTGVSGRLRGVSQVESTMPVPVPVYSFAVTVLGVSGAGTQLSVRFLLNDGTESTKNLTSKLSEEDALFDVLVGNKQEQEAVEAMLADARRQYNAQHPTVKELELKLREITKAQTVTLARARGGSGKGAVIDSTFSMNLGETVVIGTSSLKGEKALIALLTAVRRPGSQTEPTQGEKR
jgi:hypothetical protein